MIPSFVSAQASSNLGYEEEIIRPQTPNVAEFQKFGEYQMDYYTGVPNIEIPIYEVNLGHFSLPVSLRYHASGVKVQELPSCVGLGWALSAGGCISVEVKGIRDNANTIGAVSEYDFYHKNLMEIIDMISHGSDTERDTYHYSFPGHSGTFRYSQPNDTIRTIPYKPIIIEHIGQEFYKDGYKIIDEIGNAYFFTLRETMQVDDNHVETRAWYLTKIQPSQCKDSIVFKYRYDINASRYIRSYHSLYVKAGYIPPSEGAPSSYYERYGFCDRSRYLNTRTETFVMDSILWQGNSIAFEYQNRLDYADTDSRAWLKLTSVTVRNMLGHVVHRTNLAQSYRQKENHSNSKRLMLDSINVNGENYSFCYNSTNLPNYVNLYYTKCHEDMWGYYNGDPSPENGNHWFPRELNGHEILEANCNQGICPLRMPNENYCKAMMLERITYPTGGYTMFEFEPNTYEPDVYWGGLRLYSYKSYQSDGTLSRQRTYKYGFATPPDDIIDTYYMMPHEHLFFRDIPHNLCNRLNPSFIHSMPYQHAEFRGSPVIPMTEGGAPMHYLYVQEFEGSEGNYQRKTIYEYRRCKVDVSNLVSNNYHRTESIILWNKSYNYDQGNPSYELARKRIFKRLDTNRDSLIYEETNTYVVDSIKVYKAGVRVSPIVIREGRGSSPGNYVDKEGVANDYSVSDVCIIPIYSLLSSRTIIQDGISQNESFTYDPKLRTLSPKSKHVTRSDNKEQNIIYSYPFEESIYQEMYRANILTPIREKTYIDNDCVNHKVTEYGNTFGMWLPQSISIGHGQSPEMRVQYLYNAQGNISCIIKDNSIYENYIYGYNGTLPVAIIESNTYLNCENLEETGIELKTRLDNIRQSYESQGFYVSTFMYEPLVGVLWSMDKNRNCKTYEYDNRGRLINIINAEGFQESLIEYNHKI